MTWRNGDGSMEGKWRKTVSYGVALWRARKRVKHRTVSASGVLDAYAHYARVAGHLPGAARKGDAIWRRGINVRRLAERCSFSAASLANLYL